MSFDTATRTLLAADQFLQRWKTPLIVSDPEFDSFGAYLESVEAALALDPARICSSHTETIEDAAGWLTETRSSLRERRERVAKAVRKAWDGGADRGNTAGLSAERTLTALYPRASRGPLRIVFLREILAMLRNLAFGGELEREVAEDVERFRPAD
jgi:hypothetical protein